MTEILSGGTPEALARAAAVIRDGGLVAFPTETVYGLGADALNPSAVARIFEVKQRPRFDPIIVHLSAKLTGVERVVAPGTLTGPAKAIADRFWPGPLTLVLSKSTTLPDIVTAGLSTVGIRVPDHPVAQALLDAAGTPIAAPSANPFAQVSPTCAEHVAEQLGGAVDLILDGGPCRVGVESTILAFEDEGPVVYRYGGIPLEQLEEALGPIQRGVRVLERPMAPGQLARHYATGTPLVLVERPALDGFEAGLLVVQGVAPRGASAYGVIVELAPDGDLRRAAASLFAALRLLDKEGLKRIDVIPCPAVGLGRAIIDRLQRGAASFGS